MATMTRLQDHILQENEVETPQFLQYLPGVRGKLVEYYRAIRRLDQGVGLVLQALERSGLAEDTLVLLLSDWSPLCQLQDSP